MPRELPGFDGWGAWRTYVLCGGPSLRDVDLGFLRGHRVIAVNDAFRAWRDQ